MDIRITKQKIEDFSDMLLEVLKSFLITSVGIMLVLGIIFTGLAAFHSKSVGYYIEANYGYTATVYENIQYGFDRMVFIGPNGQAWKVYEFLNTPPEPDPVYKTI